MRCQSHRGQEQDKKLKEKSTISKSVEIMNLEIEVVQPSPNRRNVMKTLSRNIIIKLVKNRDKILRNSQ